MDIVTTFASPPATAFKLRNGRRAPYRYPQPVKGHLHAGEGGYEHSYRKGLKNRHEVIRSSNYDLLKTLPPDLLRRMLGAGGGSNV